MSGSNHGYGILMGDIVRSEAAGPVDRLHRIFNAAVDDCNDRHADVLSSRLTITLGDEFQGLTRTLNAAAVLARSLRLKLLADKVECRFAIGMEYLQTPLNPDRAWNMMGLGLSATRQKLNEKRTDTLYRFVLPDHPELERLFEALGAGLTFLERSWTPRQLQDIASTLEGRKPAEIAHARQVKPHTVYKVLRTGELDLYEMQWHALLEALTMLDRQYVLP